MSTGHPRLPVNRAGPWICVCKLTDPRPFRTLEPFMECTMPVDISDRSPSVYFYIGANDSDEEDEGFENDYMSFYIPHSHSTPCIPLFTQLWNDISIWEEGQDPPLKLAIEILRILQGLKLSPQESKQSRVYNTYLNKRVAKVSEALQEYKDQLCAQVFCILEECEQHEHTALKEEIQQIKKQIEQAKLISFQKRHRMRKKHSLLRDIKEALIGPQQLKTGLDFVNEDLCIYIPQEKEMNRRDSKEEDEKEEKEEEEESTGRCLRLLKLSWRK